jgi:acyl-CoA thioester hydrolase
VQFYETDLMRIVHHSNYLKFFEEARVAWAHSVGLIQYQKPESASLFAVLETQVLHLKPSYFGDLLTIDLEVKNQGVRVLFQYRARRGLIDIALGKTTHVPLNSDLKPVRLTPEMKNILKGEKWTETWL